MQEFIELAREGRGLDAITHARKFLAPNAETNMPEIQHAMAALAFSPATSCSAYKVGVMRRAVDAVRPEFELDDVKPLSNASFICILLPLESILATCRRATRHVTADRGCPCGPRSGSIE